MGPETDTNPTAAVGSYFGFDANVNHSLSGTLIVIDIFTVDNTR